MWAQRGIVWAKVRFTGMVRFGGNELGVGSVSIELHFCILEQVSKYVEIRFCVLPSEEYRALPKSKLLL